MPRAQHKTNQFRRADIAQVLRAAPGIGLYAERKKFATQTYNAFISAKLTAKELKTRGAGATNLLSIGFSTRQLITLGFRANDLKRATQGNPRQLLGMVKSLNADVLTLKRLGFSLRDIINFHYGLTSLAMAGFTIQELRKAGFTLKEFKDAKFSAITLKKAGFSFKQLCAADYSPRQLFSAGFSARELRTLGLSIHQLRDLGYNHPQLKNAGFSENEITKAGVRK